MLGYPCFQHLGIGLLGERKPLRVTLAKADLHFSPDKKRPCFRKTFSPYWCRGRLERSRYYVAYSRIFQSGIQVGIHEENCYDCPLENLRILCSYPSLPGLRIPRHPFGLHGAHHEVKKCFS